MVKSGYNLIKFHGEQGLPVLEDEPDKPSSHHDFSTPTVDSLRTAPHKDPLDPHDSSVSVARHVGS